MKILNVGCGDTKSSATNLDILGGDGILKKDFHDTGFKGDEFDMVYASHCLEHSPNPISALHEWRKIARYLWLIVPLVNEEDKDGYSPDKLPEHFFVLTERQWKNIVSREFDILATQIIEHTPNRKDLLLICRQQ